MKASAVLSSVSYCFEKYVHEFKKQEFRMNTKKIMFYISSLAKAGAQRVILNLTESLIEKGYQVTIVTTSQVENEYELPKGASRIISDIQGEEITANRIKNLKNRFCKLRNIWKKEKPDVIVSFIGKNNFMAILTAWGLKIPVAVSVRGEPMEEYYNGLLRFLAKYLFRKADGIILQTEDSKSFFPKKTTKKAVVLPNPLNPEFTFMGMDSWMLFPPSYYYRFSSEELEKMKIEMREKVQEIFDAWECEEQEEKENIIKKMKM